MGIAPADFITKPVRVAELLDWLGRTLALEWTAGGHPPPASLPAPTADEALALPAAPQLRALQELVDIGYVRGIVRRLDQIEREAPESAAFVERLRTLARSFVMARRMNGVLQRALRGPEMRFERPNSDVVLIVDDVPTTTSRCCTTRSTNRATPCWWPSTASRRCSAPRRHGPT